MCEQTNKVTMKKSSYTYDDSVKRIAVAFLSNIDLSLKEACPDCKHLNKSNTIVVDGASCSNNQELRKEIEYNKGDNFDKLNCGDLTSRNIPFYQRSVSSTLDLPVKSFHQQRQLSLTEVPARVSCSGDGPSEIAKKKSNAPVMKMKFVNEKLLQNCRLFFVEPVRHTPCAIYSVLPFVKDNRKLSSAATLENVKNKSLIGLDHPTVLPISVDGSSVISNQEISYQFLLVPSTPVVDVDLDCAEWMSGKHRTVLALNSYLVSVVGYTKPSALKRDLNQQFKTSFPSVNITLSKVRSLERQMHRTAKLFGMQTGILSCAKTYFERLVFSGHVNKANRQQVAAACFLLSAKVHGDLNSDEIRQLVSGRNIRELTLQLLHLLSDDELFNIERSRALNSKDRLRRTSMRLRKKSKSKSSNQTKLLAQKPAAKDSSNSQVKNSNTSEPENDKQQKRKSTNSSLVDLTAAAKSLTVLHESAASQNPFSASCPPVINLNSKSITSQTESHDGRNPCENPAQNNADALHNQSNLVFNSVCRPQIKPTESCDNSNCTSPNEMFTTALSTISSHVNPRKPVNYSGAPNSNLVNPIAPMQAIVFPITPPTTADVGFNTMSPNLIAMPSLLKSNTVMPSNSVFNPYLNAMLNMHMEKMLCQGWKSVADSPLGFSSSQNANNCDPFS